MSKLCQGVCQNGSAVQPQFKLEAVRLVRERGVTVAQAFGLGQLVAQVQHKVFLKHGHAILVSPSHHTPMAKRKSQEGAQFVKFFGPLLGALRELGGSGTPDEVVEQIAADLALSDEVQNELLPSGQPRFRNQVAWARFYLVQEGLLDSSKRGVWGLTEKGRATPLTHEQAREIFLRWVKVFQEQRRAKAATEEPIAEQVAEGTGSPSKDYRAETVELLLALPPAGFERLSQRLLREAGFTQVVVTGQSGDGGIDGHGTLQINPLVSFKVLFQCKRFTKSVSPSHVRDFRGAMAGRADKGIIITTGSFTAEARREGSRDGVPQIELIDGEKLIEMLGGLGTWVTPRQDVRNQSLVLQRIPELILSIGWQTPASLCLPPKRMSGASSELMRVRTSDPCLFFAARCTTARSGRGSRFHSLGVLSHERQCVRVRVCSRSTDRGAIERRVSPQNRPQQNFAGGVISAQSSCASPQTARVGS